jgi:hypothetical protein
MADLIGIMKEAYRTGYEGSLTELMENELAKETQIASTPQEMTEGLTQGPPRTMVFPDVQGRPMTTEGMNYPIDMDLLDGNGDLIRSYEKLEPGIHEIPTHGAATVVENPSVYRSGGMFTSDLRRKMEGYKGKKC